MKTIKNYYWMLLCFTVLAALVSCNTNNGEDLTIDNGKIKLSFSKENGSLVVFQDLIHGYEFLDDKKTMELPWEIDFNQAQDSLQLPLDFEYSKLDPLTLVLKWENFKGDNNKELTVTAEIKLDRDKALSYWKISLDGTQGKEINTVVFPKINGFKDLGQEKLALPKIMGELLTDPRGILSAKKRKKREWSGFTPIIFHYNVWHCTMPIKLVYILLRTIHSPTGKVFPLIWTGPII